MIFPLFSFPIDVPWIGRWQKHWVKVKAGPRGRGQPAVHVRNLLFACRTLEFFLAKKARVRISGDQSHFFMCFIFLLPRFQSKGASTPSSFCRIFLAFCDRHTLCGAAPVLRPGHRLPLTWQRRYCEKRGYGAGGGGDPYT